MSWEGRQKVRTAETWDEVRRGWERGETAASLALRYDVGLANLWRRRSAEGWRRLRPHDPAPEPVEGWDRHAMQAMEAFEARREETRLLAQALAEAMQGGPLARVPLWHAGFVLAGRAERLGPEVAAKDRADIVDRGAWTEAFWDEDGALKPVALLDAATLQANRAAWREDAGLPEGAAEDWP